MKNTTLLLSVIVFVFSCRPAQKIPESTAHLPLTELVLKNAYEIMDAKFEGAPIEPSGIAIFQDSIFFISDNHDQSIFILEEKGSTMSWKEVLRFEQPFSDMDIEGLTMNDAGDFYLVSEVHNQVLEIDRSTGTVQLIGGDIQPLLPANLNLLKEKNAKLEGISLKNDSTLLLAAERSNRGIISVQFKENGQYLAPLKLLAAREYNTTKMGEGLRKAGSIDFSEVFHFDNKTYALDRNAQCIIQLNASAESEFEQVIWSYRETMKTYGYKGKGFTDMGTAEALFIDKQKVFIAFDNNKRTNRFFKSANPILLVFDKPD